MAAMRGYGTILTILAVFWASIAWAGYDIGAAGFAFLSLMLGFGFGRQWERHASSPSSAARTRATGGATHPRR